MLVSTSWQRVCPDLILSNCNCLCYAFTIAQHLSLHCRACICEQCKDALLICGVVMTTTFKVLGSNPIWAFLFESLYIENLLIICNISTNSSFRPKIQMLQVNQTGTAELFSLMAGLMWTEKILNDTEWTEKYSYLSWSEK